MKVVVCVFTLALWAQVAAAEEDTTHFLPTDRVRYRFEDKSPWQEGMFQSISAHGLVFAEHADAPLDTLPLAALNAVELDRGKHVDGSRIPFFMTMGLLVGAVILGVAENSDCGECGYGALGYVVVGGGVGAAVGLGLGMIPVREWERVHGDTEQRRPGPWSSRGLVVKYRF